MKKNVSISDVAELSGFSIKTVSRVINSSKEVKDETRKKVQKAIKQLNYTPSFAAKTIRNGKTKLILFLSYGVTSTPFAYHMLNSTEKELEKQGYQMLTYNIYDDFEKMNDKLSKFFNTFKPEGIIFASYYHRSFSITKNTFPCKIVMANCYSHNDKSIPSFIPNEEQAGFEIASKLIEKNYKNLGFLNVSLETPAGRLRKKGIENAVNLYNSKNYNISLEVMFAENKIKKLVGVISHEVSDFHPPKQLTNTIKNMLNLPIKRDAIICATDPIAMALYFLAQKNNLSIPKQLAVTSFDNFIIISRFLNPILSSFELPHKLMGQLSAKEVLNNENSEKQNINKINMKFIKGYSF